MRIARLALFVALTACMLASCASVPNEGDTEVSITLRKAEEKDLAGFGWGFTNPYIPLNGIFLQQITGKVDFIVVVADIAAPHRVKLECLDVLVDQAGPEFYDRRKFTEFWDSYDGFERDIQIRRSRIASTYMPPRPFALSKGSSKYFLVFIGKAPLAGPFDIRADFLVNGERREVELHLD